MPYRYRNGKRTAGGESRRVSALRTHFPARVLGEARAFFGHRDQTLYAATTCGHKERKSER